jgi:hypothetical protein
MNVGSRAIRILRPMTRYRELTPKSPDGGFSNRTVKLQDGESYLGVYENIEGSLEDCILVTNLGLHLDRGGNWEFVGYTDIKTIDIPSRKDEADCLEIHRYSGPVTEIPVRGSHGRFRDSF